MPDQWEVDFIVGSQDPAIGRDCPAGLGTWLFPAPEIGTAFYSGPSACPSAYSVRSAIHGIRLITVAGVVPHSFAMPLAYAAPRSGRSFRPVSDPRGVRAAFGRVARNLYFLAPRAETRAPLK